MRIGFLGPPGTFGEEAAIRAGKDAERQPYSSHAAVAAAAESGAVDLGVLAIENSLSGSVAETLDILIHDTTLAIQAELVVPVIHNLIVRPGDRLDGVKVVFSHPQVLGQCRRFLERELPGRTFEAALSTAEAVGQVMKRGGDAAAIATERAAELHGAQVVARGIEDAANNATRFVVLGRDAGPPPTGRDRTSIAFTFPEDRPGALASVLQQFADRRINCTKIESRPTREVFGEYVFLVDFEGHQHDDQGTEVLAAIRPLCASLKVFGSYPRWR
jgi:prephenate dehydratase